MKGATVLVVIMTVFAVSLSAQWPKFAEPGMPRDAQGLVLMDAAPPKMADGKPDLSGDWLRADRDPRPAELAGIAAEQGGAARGVVVEPPVAAFAPDPNAPPLASILGHRYQCSRRTPPDTVGGRVEEEADGGR